MLTSTLNVEKVRIVASYVNYCPESHRVGDLFVEPNVFICGEQPCKRGADESKDVAQHRDKDKAAINCKNETSATSNPDGESQGVDRIHAQIRRLK